MSTNTEIFKNTVKDRRIATDNYMIEYLKATTPNS